MWEAANRREMIELSSTAWGGSHLTGSLPLAEALSFDWSENQRRKRP